MMAFRGGVNHPNRTQISLSMRMNRLPQLLPFARVKRRAAMSPVMGLASVLAEMSRSTKLPGPTPRHIGLFAG